MPFQTTVCDPHVVFTPNHTLYLQLLTNYQELRVMGKAPKWQSDVFVVQHLDGCFSGGFFWFFLIVCRFTVCETGVRCEGGQNRDNFFYAAYLSERSLKFPQAINIYKSTVKVVKIQKHMKLRACICLCIVIGG